MKGAIMLLIFGFLLNLISCFSPSSDQPNQGSNSFQQISSGQKIDSVNSKISSGRRNAITEAVSKTSPAVVGINVTEIREYADPFSQFFRNDPFFNQYFDKRTYKQEVKGLGSGFLISADGYILTNFHVAGNASKIIITMTNGKKYDAKLIGGDYVSDIALIKIDDENLPFIPMGNSDDVLIGEWVIALGNPYGLFEINDKPTVTVGVISNIGMNFQPMENRVYRGMIQTDAAINSGNSGGPLVNAMGEVLGINSFIYTGSQYNQGSIGLGFAIPINRAREIAEELKKYGKVDRSFWSGLKTQTLDPNVAKYFGLKEESGVLVVEIERGSPAEKAGMLPSDVITRINDIDVKSNQEMLIFQQDSRPGDKLEIEFIRDGKKMKKTVVLERKDN